MATAWLGLQSGTGICGYNILGITVKTHSITILYMNPSRDRGWSRDDVMTWGLAAASCNCVFENLDSKARQRRNDADMKL